MEAVGLIALIATKAIEVLRIIAVDTTNSTLYLAASNWASDALNTIGNKSLGKVQEALF